jgi:acyl dehydratase
MLNSKVEPTLSQLPVGQEIGVSPWIPVTQAMIDRFGDATLDPDPMHVDPEWARREGPFGGTIAFGFLTISLLTHLLHAAVGTDPGRDPKRAGYYLNYGFDRLRLVAPVRSGKRVRGRFAILDRRRDERDRLMTTFKCTVEIEGEERPALSAHWLTVWVPPET